MTIERYVQKVRDSVFGWVDGWVDGQTVFCYCYFVRRWWYMPPRHMAGRYRQRYDGYTRYHISGIRFDSAIQWPIQSD
jgi:hypothetical protein